MKTCSKCNYENVDYANNCANCGYPFKEAMDNMDTDSHKFPDNVNRENMPNNINSHQNVPQNNIPQNNVNYQQNSNQYQMYNNQQVRPQNQKSKAIGLILNIILVGLGYAYVGKWGEGIVMFVVYLLMWILGFFLFIPWIIAIALWVYSLFKTNEMIDNYNNGLPY